MSVPVQDAEIDIVRDIYRAYDRPLGASGVLLGLAVVTEQNDARVRVVIDEMSRRGLLVMKHPARHDVDALYELAASCVPGEPE